MKRDMDIIRTVVLAVRDSDKPLSSISGIAPKVFIYHAQLLEEAGLVTASFSGGGKPLANAAMIFRLTWTGQDFADSIKDESIWNKAKENILKPSASWTFGILAEYIKAEITRKLSSGN
ncbi:DUF2513 domain-containing protein [Tichowtungia aerotolerans]|uniref:DUF2513 domain-containing protein n=1 Tax=Tichowtungia aerotolerans TaxID=2697043 RepID=A0A6P1M6V8_9BACT|nr:DUF2513 domain-containing protein [Tichowtungia aerotolerans]QHI68743.1 DUF2513 domain-containing protein [Tichowtungia aerotolerans]